MTPPVWVRALLADAPPAVGPVPASARPLWCQSCGLTGGDWEDFRSLSAPGAPGERVVCRLCLLGWTAAWEPNRLRLALVPECEQAPLNAIVTLLLVSLLRARAGEAGPAQTVVLHARLLEALQQRARRTCALLPCAATAATLRQTLRALPPDHRDPLLQALGGLRYLPEPADPDLARFFHRRRRLRTEEGA